LADEIAQSFSSFNGQVIRESGTKTTVACMLKSKASEAIAVKNNKIDLNELEKMIKLASESSV
jgi:hypothetical protein